MRHEHGCRHHPRVRPAAGVDRAAAAARRACPPALYRIARRAGLCARGRHGHRGSARAALGGHRSRRVRRGDRPARGQLDRLPLGLPATDPLRQCHRARQSGSDRGHRSGLPHGGCRRRGNDSHQRPCAMERHLLLARCLHAGRRHYRHDRPDRRHQCLQGSGSAAPAGQPRRRRKPAQRRCSHCDHVHPARHGHRLCRAAGRERPYELQH